MLLLIAIALPLALSLLASVPAIQNAVVQKLTAHVSEKLGTKVSIEHIDVKSINHIVVDGFLVEDFNRDTLLWVPRVSVPVIEWGLGRQPLTFGHVKVEGAEMWIKRDSLGVLNIKEIVYAIRGGREPSLDSKFRMLIMGIEGEGITFGLLRDDKPLIDKGVDFSRFIIRNTRADIDELYVSRDTVRIGIRSASLDERTGFHLDDISADDLVVSRGAVRLDNVKLRALGADLDVPLVLLDAGRKEWELFEDFNDSISLDIRVRRSHLTTDLVGAFVPFIPFAADRGLVFDDFSAHVKGPLSNLAGGIDGARTLSTTLSLDFSSRGLPDLEQAWFDVSRLSLQTTGDDVEQITTAALGGELQGRESLGGELHGEELKEGELPGRGLPEKIIAPVRRLGDIGLEAKITGRLDDFDASALIVSGGGDIETAAKIARGDDAVLIDGNIVSDGLDAGKLLAVRDLGRVTGEFAVSGSLRGGDIAGGTVEGGFSRLEFRGYPYSNLTARASFDGTTYEGTLAARDRNLDLDLQGSIIMGSGTEGISEYDAGGNSGGAAPRGRVSLDVRRADLAATHLNGKDSVSVISGELTAQIGGSDFDDLDGVIEARRLMYRSPHGIVGTPLVELSSHNTVAGKQLELRSEFVDADFRTRLDYRDLFALSLDYLAGYIPIPRSDAKPLPALATGSDPASAENYTTIKIVLKQTDPLLGALVPGMHIAAGSDLSVNFNPYIDALSMGIRSDQLQYRDVVAAEIDLTTENVSDSLVVHLSAGDIYAESMHIPDFVLHGGAKERRMNLSTRFAEENGSFSGMLGMVVTDGIDDRDHVGGAGEDDGAEPALGVHFLPSRFSLDDKTWRVASGEVQWRKGRTRIDNFRIVSRGEMAQNLTANGTISRAESDTLHLEMNRFDLSPLEKLSGGRSLALQGRATGYIDAVSLSGDPKVNALIDLDSLSLGGVSAPSLTFTSLWDEAGRQIRFGMIHRESRKRILGGAVSPKERSMDATLAVDSIDVAMLDPVLGNMVENSSGKVSLDLTASGTFDRLRLDGHVSVPRLETTVKYTRATYTLEGGEFTIADSRLELPSLTVRDRFGGTGELSLSIDAANLRDMRVAVDARVRSLLVFDTPPDPGESFYGQVFATGSAEVRSGRMGSRIDISARTDRGTRFHLPLNAKSDMAWADFVTFVDPARREGDRGDALVRIKRLYERRTQEGGRTRRRKPLDVGFTVALTPEAELHLLIDPGLGDGITAHGEGVINLDINPASNIFSMTGGYTISEGRFEFSMADVFNKNFTISPGSSLRWSGAPDNALLDIDAIYRLRTSLTPLVGEGNPFSVSDRSTMPVDCILSLNGPLSAPEIAFDIALPSADPDVRSIMNNAMNTPELKSMQFLSLLMTGSFVTDNSITGQSATSGAMATGAVGFDILTNQLGNFLSSDDYDIYFRYRPQQNFLSNQIDVGFSTGILDDRLLLEIEGNYVDDRAATSVGTNASNLAGDVSLTWVIDRAGNLRLKVFSRQIDRLNESQGLQESGLGLYWKKDFNRFRDIFRRSERRRRK